MDTSHEKCTIHNIQANNFSLCNTNFAFSLILNGKYKISISKSQFTFVWVGSMIFWIVKSKNVTVKGIIFIKQFLPVESREYARITIIGKAFMEKVTKKYVKYVLP